MREILFRGKTQQNTRWIYGDLNHYMCDDGVFIAENGHSMHRVFKETAGQYTGLTDKNGTKIFEGDIVSISGDFKGIYTCVWEEHHFDYELENKTMRCCLACVYSDDIKVIGNITDNPELLKGGAE